MSEINLNVGRWGKEGKAALASLGYTVIDYQATDDYQGSCVILGKKISSSAVPAIKQKFDNDLYAVLSWTYGSCSGCDGFEGLPYKEVVAMLAKDTIVDLTKSAAYTLFEQEVSRFW